MISNPRFTGYFMEHHNQIRIIQSSTPIRINDIGGWTDTWFSGSGKVVNMAVRPGVKVLVKVKENTPREKKRIYIHAVNYSQTFSFDPDSPDGTIHPLLQAAVAACPPPDDLSLEITVKSAVPAGISTGTSASVCVALLGALFSLREDTLRREDIARFAHRVETENLGWQSGIQDQISASCGGIRYIDMPSYPEFRTEIIILPENMRNELENRLCLFDLGGSHSSSDLHHQVIGMLENEGSGYPLFQDLRDLADKARQSLQKEDLSAFGRIMTSNTELQRSLHSDLVSSEADIVIKTARSFGAAGWKVNGAGGRGGSLTVLGPCEPDRMRLMKDAIADLGREIRELPVSLDDRGLITENIRESSQEPSGGFE